MSKLKKILFIALGMFIIIIALTIKSHAASLTISTSKSTVAPGESFTVTVRLSNGAGSISSTGHAAQWLDNSSYSYTMTAGNSNVSISASGVAGDYTTEKNENVGASAIVKVVQSPQPSNGGNTNPSPSASNNTSKPSLNNLGIRPYDFSGFRAANYSYSVNVPNDCTSVTVYASSANGTVSGTGAINLKEGTNVATVTVSNSNGSQKYTISINRANAENDEDVTNEKPEENAETPENPVLGLSVLSIDGYSLDKEFSTDVFEYKVEIDKPLTKEELELIKEKVTATASAENVNVEIFSNIDDNNNATITVVVKDTEKEYSQYVIKFVVKEEEKHKAAGVVVPLKGNDNGFFDYAISKSYTLMGLALIGIIFGMFFAIRTYTLSRKLARYEDDYEEDYDEDNEIYEEEPLQTYSHYGKKQYEDVKVEEPPKVSDGPEPSYYIGLGGESTQAAVDQAELTSDILSTPKSEDLYASYNQVQDAKTTQDEKSIIEELEKNESTIETVKEAATRASRLSGYRNLRSKKVQGRHF